MTVSIVARVVRIPVIAAAVVVPMLAAACSNDPMSPRSQGPQLSSGRAVSDSSTSTAKGGSIPWYDAGSTAKGGSIPWY